MQLREGRVGTGMKEGKGEDRDEIVRRIGERLAQSSSRRGVILGLGRLTLGAAALVAAQGVFGRVAEAAAALHCCDGKACADYVCPAGTHPGYTWSCSHYFCHDCFSDTEKNKKGKPKYVCTYSLKRHTPVH